MLLSFSCLDAGHRGPLLKPKESEDLVLGPLREMGSGQEQAENIMWHPVPMESLPEEGAKKVGCSVCW